MIFLVIYLVIGAILGLITSISYSKFGKDYSDSCMSMYGQWTDKDKYICISSNDEFSEEISKIFYRVIWFIPVFWLPMLCITGIDVLKAKLH